MNEPQPKATSVTFTVTYSDGVVVSYCVAAPEQFGIAVAHSDTVLDADALGLSMALKRKTELNLKITPGPTGFRAWISPVPDLMTGVSEWPR